MVEMKDSGIKWVGEIPKNWAIIHNKYIMYKRKEIITNYNSEDILSLTMKGVIKRDLNEGGKMPSSFDGYQKINKGNLLLCLFDIDVTPRCVGIIKDDGITSPAYSQFVIRSSNDVRYYYYYYLMTDNGKALVHLSKSLRHSLNEDQFGNINTIKPPLSEQQAIADFLDKKCADVNRLSEQIQKEIDALQEYRKSVITKAVTKGLNENVLMKDSGMEWIGEIPQNWSVQPLYTLFKERKNKNTKGKEQNLLSLSYGNIIRKNINQLGGLLPASFTTYSIVEKNDIIIRPTDLQNDRKSLRTGLVREHGIITSAYIDLMPLNNTNSAFYHYQLHAYDIEKVFYNMGNGVRQGLNYKEFKKIKLIVPPTNVANEIVIYLDDKTSQIDKIISEKQKQLSLLSDYKNSLIFQYVTGKKQVPIGVGE